MTRHSPDNRAGGDAGRNGVRRAARLPLVAAMVVAVVAAGTLRHTAVAYQENLSNRATGGGRGHGPSASALGSMNSFALALLLGGLRGPLAMILWATSEAQKADRNLEDFDTKVEWIRLLQPEFDTVHMFQIWNKAYNISVQMASLPNRYATILDAIDYAADVDRDRPANINITNAVAQVYSNKLGTPHTEKSFYRRWVREQSYAPADYKPGQAQERLARRNQGGWQRRRLDPKLDAAGMLLPEVLAEKWPRPADLPAGGEWNTGAEMQYLTPYQPFPYGVSTFALAYNYAKRAQVLMTVGNQTPLQVSEMVLDSRPAVELNQWAHDEWERGRQFELQSVGIRPPANTLDMELPTATLPSNRPPADPVAAATAVYSYDMAARVAGDAIREYNRHMAQPKYVDRADTYASHLDDMIAIGQLCSADRDYLKAMSDKDASEREPLLRAAADNYQKALGTLQLIILKYYVDPAVMEKTYPPGVTRETVKNLSRQEQDQTMARVRAIMDPVGPSASTEDYDEYARYIARATTRLGMLLRQ